MQPMEAELVVEQPQAPRLQPELPNGMEKVQVREVEKRSKLNVEELNRIEDEDVLDKMVRPSLWWCGHLRTGCRLEIKGLGTGWENGAEGPC